MQAIPFSVATYLATQIREIVDLGPMHALTWAPRSDCRPWLQVTVHGEDHHYLDVQIRVDDVAVKRRVDRVFKQNGWLRSQAGAGDCLLYYVARCGSVEKLLTKVDGVARMIAAAMEVLWGATVVEHVVLLAARGPRIPIQRFNNQPMLTAGPLALPAAA